MNPNYTAVSRPRLGALEANKVLKNTYLLLSATLAFSAVMAMLSMAINVPPVAYIISLIASMVLGIFVLPKTGIIFLGLSGYALTSKKDFSFLGGFLFAGMMVVVLAIIASLFIQMPALSLTISAAVIMLMSGLILFDTSRIINGGETNYIMATYSIFLSIFNIFISLLNILGIMGDD